MKKQRDKRYNEKTALIGSVLCIFFLNCLPSTVNAWTKQSLPNRAWGQLLSRYAVNGRVDYQGLKRNQHELDQSLKEFSKISRQTYGKWGRNQQIAFWINAYNLFTIKAVVDHYPPKGSNLLYPKVSVQQIGQVWGKAAYRTAGQLVSLNQIKNRILRGAFKYPHAHFALVSASLSSPPLVSLPYDGESLEKGMERQIHLFLSDPEHGLHWDDENRTLYLSEMFSWYGKDFYYYYTLHKRFPGFSKEKRYALNFIWNYLPEELREILSTGNFTIKYMDYDWSLNDRVKEKP